MIKFYVFVTVWGGGGGGGLSLPFSYGERLYLHVHWGFLVAATGSVLWPGLRTNATTIIAEWLREYNEPGRRRQRPTRTIHIRTEHLVGFSFQFACLAAGSGG